jgi:hypothetical protein
VVRAYSNRCEARIDPDAEPGSGCKAVHYRCKYVLRLSRRWGAGGLTVVVFHVLATASTTICAGIATRRGGTSTSRADIGSPSAYRGQCRYSPVGMHELMPLATIESAIGSETLLVGEVVAVSRTFVQLGPWTWLALADLCCASLYTSSQHVRPVQATILGKTQVAVQR